MNTYKIKYSVGDKLFTDTIESLCLETAIDKLELKEPNHKILDIEAVGDDFDSTLIWTVVGFVVCAFTVFCVLAGKGVLWAI